MGLTLTTDRANYAVGQTPTYTISEGQPGAALAWTSYLDGDNTGEYQAQYGQYLDQNGTAILQAGGPWTNDYIGYWKKEVLAILPDGSTEVARVNFSVSADGSPVAPPAVVAPGAQNQNSGILSGDFFSGNYTLPIIGQVPKLLVLGGAGVLLFYLTSKGK